MLLADDRQKVAHLLRRFGLGASEAELDFYGNDIGAAVEKLLAYEKIEDAFEFPIERFLRDGKALPVPAVQAWWLVQIITTRRPLKEKLAVFWHDHFATSASKVNRGPLLYQQVNALRDGASGSFRDLLQNMSKDPAMLFWLDNQYNVAGKPNENFAREVMELFTLGIGNYGERDVQEAARAFTGWAFRRGRAQQQGQVSNSVFLYRPGQHDDGEKTVLGRTGPLTGEDVVDLLCDHPQTPRYITRKMWEWFAYPNPQDGLVDRIATKFKNSGLDIKSLVRAIASSDEFYSDRAVRAVYKNPVDFVVPTLRQLGVGEELRGAIERSTSAVPSRGVIRAAQQALDGMGMSLLYPPDVAGWEGGASWISSGTMVERIAWADRLFGQAPKEGKRQQLNFKVLPLLAADPTPQGIVSKLLSVFDAPLPESKRPILEEVAKKALDGSIINQSANEAASKVCRLIFGSPEFQFA